MPRERFRTSPLLRYASLRSELLESRRLLTVTFTGDPATGVEEFFVTIDGGTIRVRINVGPEQSTTDPNVIVNALGGTNRINIIDNTGGTRPVPFTLETQSISSTTLNIGTALAPINLDRFRGTIISNMATGSIVNVFDQDDPTVSGGFTLSTATGPSRQIVTKGVFTGSLPQASSGNTTLVVSGSNASDVFAIAGVSSNLNVHINGGGGDDALITTNSGINNRDNDLDEVFAGFSFDFDGGPGNDFLDLDDSADQTNDGDDIYILELGSLGAIRKAGAYLVNFDQTTVEQIYFGADDGPSTIRLWRAGVLALNPQVTVVGGGGDDLITNTDVNLAGKLDHLERVGGAFVGGPGNDRVELFDSNVTDGRLFQFSGNALRIGGTIGFDLNTLESMLIEDGDLQSNFDLYDKPASMTLTVNANGGADSFNVGNGNIGANGWLNGNVTLTGGLGNDGIVFNDSSASGSAAFPGDYHFDNLTFRKSGPTLFYAGFDVQSIHTSDVISGAIAVPATVNFNTLNGFITSTTVRGGDVRDIVVNVGTGQLNNLAGSFSIQYGAAGGVTYVDDSANTLARAYTVNNSGLTSPIQVINSVTPGAIIIKGGLGADTVQVNASNGMPSFTFRGGDGNDTLTVGNGSLDAIVAPVTFIGGAGTADRVIFNRSTKPGIGTSTVNSGTTSIDGGPAHNHSNDVEQVEVIAGTGGSNLRVNSSAAAVTVTGGTGSDSLVVGNGDYTANIRGNVTFNAGSGDDFITYDDAASTGNDIYTFTSNTLAKASPAATTITNSVEHKTLEAGSGNNLITGTTSLDTYIRGNAGNDTISLTGASSPVRIDTGPEDTTSGSLGDSVTIDDGSNATGITATLAASDAIRLIAVARGDKLVVPQGVVLTKDTNTVNTITGTIDLAGGAMLLRNGASNLPNIRGLVVRGYNAGAWNGSSPSGVINSSTANTSAASDGVGYATGAQISLASVGSFSIGANDVLVRHTLNGDANLDRTVNFDDLLKLAAAYNTTGTSIWAAGDFTYDAATNFDDLLALAANYNQSLAAFAALHVPPGSPPVFGSRPPRDGGAGLPGDAPAGVLA